MSPRRGVLVLVAMWAAALATGCAAPPAPATELLDTYWRAVEIDGAPVRLHPGTREPHIVLRKEDRRLSGYAGCNNLAGGYELAGDRLRFGRLAVTRRACIGDGANELEAAFLRALEAAAAWTITGEALELRDAGGKTRLKLEARYLR